MNNELIERLRMMNNAAASEAANIIEALEQQLAHSLANTERALEQTAYLIEILSNPIMDGDKTIVAGNLQEGDKVCTDYSGRMTVHTIIERCDDRSHGHSQSGIMFRVAPLVRGSSGGWIDAAWFVPFGAK